MQEWARDEREIEREGGREGWDVEEVDALCDSWMGSNDKVERERETGATGSMDAPSN